LDEQKDKLPFQPDTAYILAQGALAKFFGYQLIDSGAYSQTDHVTGFQVMYFESSNQIYSAL
jgi:hypothetical protein